jgi:hypothetical protein
MNVPAEDIMDVGNVWVELLRQRDSGRMNAFAQDIRDVGNVWVELSRQRDVLSLRKGNA